MVEVDPLVIAGLVALFGIGTVVGARKPYGRYKTITDIMTDSEGIDAPGEETTLRGPVSVTDPAVPERPPPEPADETDDPAALWAWRVRRKVNTGGDRSGTRWKTVESGLSVGDFTVEQDWEHVEVDGEWLTDAETGDETDDPFDSPNLYLGDPEKSVPLGELDPLNRLLERLGVTGDDGMLSDWEFTVSAGRKTMTPDRYQATVIRDGDELLVRGELVETADGYALRGTDETPLRVVVGRLEEKSERLRAEALKRALFGVGLILVGGAVALTAL
ncbi:hypothetical protein [Halorussus amylolyticus]|uniref:hypothetical protein n=1 Tax=Halorussus amylolyticus TaxID=1126242 RepID=UPI001046148B|nr:hypothetical protein [Halorussus amylolyticus]